MKYLLCRDPDAEPCDVWIDERIRGWQTSLLLRSKNGEVFEYTLPLRSRRGNAEDDARLYAPEQAKAYLREPRLLERAFGILSVLT
ncbi:hypothetical protein HYW59_02755 [Candidatus Kaiserbacteria bacterium]|nr:hypothetical protein [Candidatus Kaiserbacteria bacterium]